MNRVHLLSLAFALPLLGTSAWAALNDEHTDHHPAGSTPTTNSQQAPSKKTPSIANMVTQTQAMRAMHEKTLAATTSEERSALMAEHIKTMQDGIPMMNGMPSDISMHQQMMEKRIEMMGASMQMMMDRLPPVPAN